MDRPQVTILIPSLICLDTALPYIAALYRRKVGIHFVVDHHVRELYANEFRGALSVIEIDALVRKHRLTELLHSFLRLALTRQSFSPIYRRWLQQRLDGKGKLARLLALLAVRHGPKCSNDKVNKYLSRWLGRIMSNPFSTKRIIYISATGKPHLLCGRGLEVYTIMESWDHPGKAPMGHASTKVFVWNAALEQDWVDFQGDNRVGRSYPIKLAYAISANDLGKGELLKPAHNRIMYPTTFGSTSDKRMFTEELKFVYELCRATEKTGQKLLIKPKPNSIEGELDQFLKFSHVEIGRYQTNEGGSNYRLSESYNQGRIRELKRCDVVINLGTTFAMDAAAYGLPVIQLQLSCPQQYPLLSSLSAFPHLQRHYYRHQECLFKLTDTKPVSHQLSFLSEPSQYLSVAETFSLRLRDWLIPDWSLSEAVEHVINDCLATEESREGDAVSSSTASESK